MNRTDPEQYLPLTPLAFEVLLAVADSSLHGYDIMLAVEQRTGGQLSPNPGTLYQSDTASNLTAMALQTASFAGGSQPHNNMSPYLTVTFMIALQGVFPARP